MKFCKLSLILLIAISFFVSCFTPTTPSKIVDASPKKSPPDPPKLVLMVYMAADNDLENYAIQNLKQMEHAEFGETKVIAIVDRAEGYDETNDNWTDTRVFEIEHDDTNSNFIVSHRLDCPILGIKKDKETELDMAQYTVLRDFIAFSKERYSNAKSYSLVMWGHGTGWRAFNAENRAVAIDDKTKTYMPVVDIGKALEGKNISIIGFDTCFGGVLENVYELRNSSEYIVASPDITPSIGWNYKSLLENLDKSDYQTKTIANIMASSSHAKMTTFNSSKIEIVFDSLESFSKSLSGTVTESSSRDFVFNKLFKSKSYSYTQYPCDMYLDIYDMAAKFESSENNEVKHASAELKRAVDECAETVGSVNAEIGIHFIPKISANTVAAQHSSEYMKDSGNKSQCSFIKESSWWVPTISGKSESLLDKLFYKEY